MCKSVTVKVPYAWAWMMSKLRKRIEREFIAVLRATKTKQQDSALLGRAS